LQPETTPSELSTVYETDPDNINVTTISTSINTPERLTPAETGALIGLATVILFAIIMVVLVKCIMWGVEIFELGRCPICRNINCCAHWKGVRPKVQTSPPPRRKKSRRHSERFAMDSLSVESEDELFNVTSLNCRNAKTSTV
jgi:hypothetical protein